MDAAYLYDAFCGLPPAPGTLWMRWQFDPLLIGALAMVAAIYALGARRAGLGVRRRACFWAGWAGFGLAFLSPLCALAVALFSARIGQHMILALAVAPLLVAGRPDAALRALGLRLPPMPGAAASAAGFALALWFWHLPAPYDATFRSDTLFWAMHLSLIASACAAWHAMLHGSGLARIMTALATASQMGLLGAILTLAPRPLFGAHLLTADAWGLSALADQQFGGLLMWVPGGLGLLAVGVAAAAAAARGLPESATHR